MMACADKLSNVRSMKRDYLILGDQLWNRFNRGYEDQKWYYTQLVDSLVLIRNSHAYQEFADLVDELFHR